MLDKKLIDVVREAVDNVTMLDISDNELDKVFGALGIDSLDTCDIDLELELSIPLLEIPQVFTVTTDTIMTLSEKVDKLMKEQGVILNE